MFRGLGFRVVVALLSETIFRGFWELLISFGFFWGPQNKDYRVLGPILGSPVCGNYPIGRYHILYLVLAERCCSPKPCVLFTLLPTRE